MSQPELLDLMAARSGIVCAVGAGGKKTVLYALAAAHPGRIAFTTTVHTTHPPEELGFTGFVARDAELLGRAAELAAVRRAALFGTEGKPGRHGGLEPETITRLHALGRFEATFVKADGARMRWIKAPRQYEPVLPPDTRTVIGVLSARAIGEPLTDRIAHRVDLVSAVTGCAPGEIFGPEHMGRLIASPEGLGSGTGDTLFVPVLNAVDDPQREALATAAARAALDLDPDLHRVILTCMRDAGQPVVAEVRR
ncbi:MAG: selenium cofactor biosynthesis protein YqeC [Gammaproteobacteria bacterium]